MTVHEAIQEVRKVETIRAENGKLKLRFPKPERASLEQVIETLRHNREIALKALSGAESDPATVPPAAMANDDSLEHRGVSREQWKADILNRLFLVQGRTGQPGRITAATVRHGERRAGDHV